MVDEERILKELQIQALAEISKIVVVESRCEDKYLLPDQMWMSWNAGIPDGPNQMNIALEV